MGLQLESVDTDLHHYKAHQPHTPTE